MEALRALHQHQAAGIKCSTIKRFYFFINLRRILRNRDHRNTLFQRSIDKETVIKVDLNELIFYPMLAIATRKQDRFATDTYVVFVTVLS